MQYNDNITKEEADNFRGLDRLAWSWWNDGLSQYEVRQIFGGETAKNDPPPIHVVVAHMLGQSHAVEAFDAMSQAVAYFDPEYNKRVHSTFSRPKFAQVAGRRCLYFEYENHIYHVNVTKVQSNVFKWETYNFDRELKGAPVESFAFVDLHGFLTLYDFVGSRTRMHFAMDQGRVQRLPDKLDARRYTGDVTPATVYPQDIVDHMKKMEGGRT